MKYEKALILIRLAVGAVFLFINFANAQTNTSTPAMPVNPRAFNVEKELGFMSIDLPPKNWSTRKVIIP